LGGIKLLKLGEKDYTIKQAYFFKEEMILAA